MHRPVNIPFSSRISVCGSWWYDVLKLHRDPAPSVINQAILLEVSERKENFIGETEIDKERKREPKGIIA